jgi:hypothetical protein
LSRRATQKDGENRSRIGPAALFSVSQGATGAHRFFPAVKMEKADYQQGQSAFFLGRESV